MNLITLEQLRKVAEGILAKVKEVFATKEELETGLSTKSDTGHSHNTATTSTNGFMSSSDKSKLDGIDAGANNYTHPSTHAASMITQDSTHRFVTDTEKSTWNAKASTSVASSTANGLMSSSDKSKLDGIAQGAQVNADITKAEIEAKLTGAITTHTHKYAGSSSAGGAATSANKVNKNITVKLNSGETEDTDLFTFNGSAAKTIDITPAAIGASASGHGHGASEITEDSTHRFVTDAEKSTWNAKASTSVATTSANGLMSSTDKTKLDGIAEGAQVNADITKAEIEAKLTGTISTHTHKYAGSSSAGGAANSVKTNLIVKLNGGTTEGTNLFTFNGSTAKTINITPAAIGASASGHGHAASEITEDNTHRFVTDTEKAAWNAKASTAVASSTANGLMSSDDKTKLDGIAEGAQKNSDITKAEIEAKLTGAITSHNHGGLYYTESEIDSKISTLNTSITNAQTNAVASAKSYTDQQITALVDSAPDAMNTLNELASAISDHQDVYDAYVESVTAALAGKSDDGHGHDAATTSADGFMTSAMVTKLNGIATGANKYTHPSTHAATMITQDATHRFVTDTEKSTWNAKASTAVATTSANGLMSSGDKTKLDSIAQGAQVNADITKAEIEAKLTGTITSHSHTSVSGNAGSANKVNNNMIVKLNSGETEGTDLFTFNGSAAKTIDITPAAIGAAASSHTQAASTITEDSTHRFVTDTEKSTWNAKASTAVATTSANGLMSSTDKTKLDGIAEGAQVNADITKAEIEAKLTGAITSHTHKYAGSSSAGGAATSANKVNKSIIIKLNSGTTEGTNLFTFNGSAAKTIDITPAAIGASASGHGHGASEITEDSTHRFVTDAEKSTWNAKASTAVATTSANGLMSSAMVTKLNGIAQGAQVNADITKAEIEAKLTGAITSHTHAFDTSLIASEDDVNAMIAALDI